MATTSFRRAPQCVLTLDEDGSIVEMSETVAALWPTGGKGIGHATVSTVGQRFWDALAPDWTDRPVEQVHGELDDGAAHAEVLVHCATEHDGDERWFEVTLRPLRASQPGFDVLLRDVTERIRIREELEAERDRRNAIVAHSSDAVLFFRPDCSIEWASPATERLFGVRAEELVGRNGVELIHPDDRDRAFLTFLTMDTLGSEARLEFRYVAPDGSVRWIEEVATNLVDDPHVGCIVANLRDVTERHRAEERIGLQARLLDAVGQAVVALDTERRVIYWNDAATELYGWNKDEAMGVPVAELIRPARGWEAEALEIVGRVRSGGAWVGEFWVRRRDGSSVPVMVTDTPVYDAQGELIATLGVSSDLSERIQAERLQRHLSAVVTSSSDAILTATVDGVITTWNDSATLLLGYSADEMVGQPVRALVPDDKAEEFGALMQQVAAGISIRDRETVRSRSDGSRVVVSLSLSPIRDRTGDVVEISAILRDVTERRAAQDELEHRSLHDPLTGLPNRDHLLGHLRAALAPSDASDASDTPAQPVAVAFLDLDHFNLVNDSLGHSAGDRLLVALGARLAAGMSDADHVGRFGGDEFVAIRIGCHDEAEAEAFAEELRRIVTEPFEIDGRRYSLTASAGVCIARPGDDPEDVLDDADAAMYAAKELGADRVTHFDDAIRRRSEQRLELANELRSALDEEQLRVWYQPVVSVADGELRGFEALVRWQHPTEGLIAPSEFIPAAEATGLIVPIGEWVLRTAVRQLAEWRRADSRCGALWMSVNLSGRQIEQPDLVATAHRIVAESGLNPRAVHLEVTESLLMETGGSPLSTLRSLRSLGFHISVDHFGTGYSSLSYLKHLPVDTLKVDRSFVAGLGTDERDRSIARAVVDLATSLGLDVIAEGVEDATQASIVRELGCGLGQGYHWAMPSPPEAIAPATWSADPAAARLG